MAQDGLNAPCAGLPYNDGDAFYQSFAQVLQCEPPIDALATPNGLLVTVFRFKVIGSGPSTQVLMAPAAPCNPHDGCGSPGSPYCCNPPDCTVCSFARTQVVGGPYPGGDATGTIGGPASIQISDCPAPTAEVEGCRYIGVTPAEGPESVALLVTGVDDDVSCVSSYVQVNGTLGANPYFQAPQDWGAVHVRGEKLWSEMTYNVQADCSPPANPGTNLSSPVSATLRMWGDVNLDYWVDFTDITLVVDGLRGLFHAADRPCTTDANCFNVAASYHQECDTSEGLCIRITLQDVDINGEGCTPDAVVDFLDILWCVDAFRGIPYPCPVSCP